MDPSSESPTPSGSGPDGFNSFVVSLDEKDKIQSNSVSKKTNSKCYFIPVTDPLPGCTEPFQLPAGTTTCPVEACPRHGDIFSPDWRVNEHMKMRHAWPRKNTQPLTDKRVNSKLAKPRAKATERLSSASAPTPSSGFKKIQPRPVTQAVYFPPRERKEFLSALEKRNIEEWMYAQPDEDEEEEGDTEKKDLGPAVAQGQEHISEDVEMKDVDEQINEAHSDAKAQSTPAVDEAMMAEATAYIAWLDGQKPLHPSQNAVRSVLSQMVNRKLFRTGQVLPSRAQSSMLAVYRLLETRAADCASEASSTSSPAPSTASLSRSSYGTPPAASPSGARPKTLKLTFSSGGEPKH